MKFINLKDEDWIEELSSHPSVESKDSQETILLNFNLNNWEIQDSVSSDEESVKLNFGELEEEKFCKPYRAVSKKRNLSHPTKLENTTLSWDLFVAPKFKRDCNCPSILIVDDQYINRFIIKSFCEKYSIPCVEAEDGQEALEAINFTDAKYWCKGFELILMDLNMPIMGGIEAAIEITKLRERNEINPSMQLVAVTAFPSNTEKNKWYSVGFEQFIVKPFTIHHFLKLISG